MQNIQERLTGLWPATGANSRRTARFAVSISASLTAGLTTSVAVILLPAHPASFAHKFLFPRVLASPGMQ